MSTAHYPGAKIQSFPLDSDQRRADALYITVGFGQSQPPTTHGPDGSKMSNMVLAGDTAWIHDINNAASQDAVCQSWGGFSYKVSEHPPSPNVKSAVDAAYVWFMAQAKPKHDPAAHPDHAGKKHT